MRPTTQSYSSRTQRSIPTLAQRAILHECWREIESGLSCRADKGEGHRKSLILLSVVIGRAEAGADIVAEIIEFYIANGFRRNVEQLSPARRSEVIEFSSRIRTKAMRKHNGNPHTSFGLGLWPGAGADISGSVRPAEGGRIAVGLSCRLRLTMTHRRRMPLRRSTTSWKSGPSLCQRSTAQADKVPIWPSCNFVSRPRI